RKDVMDTPDGLSKFPYIRESRRLRAKETVLEQDIGEEFQPGPRAKWFADSIGTGYYMIDIHPCGANERGRMMMPRPFQIPMGTLIPRGVSNFLAAGKNIGVTHLTNGAFRLHPVEWNVGEAAGMIASIALEGKPESQIQPELARAGVPLVWFDDLPVTDEDYAAIQLAAIKGIYPLGHDLGHDLHASPDAPVTRSEAAVALAAWLGRGSQADRAIQTALGEGWMAADHRNWFHPDLPFYWTDWRETNFHLPAFSLTHTGPVRRRELARRLAASRPG
ncbi:MAG: FAD-dependent oxidoreductase, partial [Acidobacteriota bacterium]|nr:FAD-dependent oxidoreductase [Acidobacteriota bacterium]